MNETIEAAARARGISVEAFRREVAEFARMRASKGATTTSRPGVVPLRGSARAPRAIGTLRPATTPQESATTDTEAQLAAAFQRRGLSAEAASIAALPLAELRAAARKGARGIREAAVKNVAGLPASCFAWVPDPEDPTTWQLQIARSADNGSGEWLPDEDLVRAAVAQVPGIAGYDQALDIPAADLPGVKSILRSAWIACGAALNEMPSELNQEARGRERRW